MRDDEFLDFEYSERKRKKEQQQKEAEPVEEKVENYVAQEKYVEEKIEINEKPQEKGEDKTLDKDIFFSGNVGHSHEDSLEKKGKSGGAIKNAVKNRIEMAKFEVSEVKEEYNSQKDFGSPNKVVGIIVAIIAVLFFVCFMLISMLQEEIDDVVMFIFIGAFVVFSIVLVGGLTVKQRAQLKKPTADCIRKNAVVLGSVRSSETSTPTRITIIYKVKLKVDDREIYTYCKTYLQEGRNVVVYMKKDSYKYCYIAVDESMN